MDVPKREPIKIRSKGALGPWEIIIGGVDVAGNVRSFRVDSAAGEIATVTVEYVAIGGIDFDVEEAVVVEVRHQHEWEETPTIGLREVDSKGRRILMMRCTGCPQKKKVVERPEHNPWEKEYVDEDKAEESD